MACHLAAAQRWRKAHLGEARARAARWIEKNRNGLEPGEREEMLARQGGGCAICGTNAPGAVRGGWHLDHDHRYAKHDKRGHRGLLCSDCNLGLGRFHDNVAFLLEAATYLLQAGEKEEAPKQSGAKVIDLASIRKVT